ncbi:MAG TPA: HhH-GPD-type base excision DNA repair protein [Streptosporangiaceae bacterium]|jgi:uncharacterized HhH-GPD family protein|nr:HhH-GPD-type base excision DNA repair protein [Streptosporangiaceae bacterium]
MTLSLPVDPAANELLSRSPLALLMGLLLDQQVPFEKAFSGPYELTLRLGHEPTAEELAGFDPGELAAIFAERPALHRFPKAMAARVQELGRQLIEHYEGDGEQVWVTAATGEELRDRLSRLPGFGAYKAQMAMALLGKQLGVQPPGWREAAGSFGHEGSYVSVADIVDEDSLARVRAYKKAAKAAAKAGSS